MTPSRQSAEPGSPDPAPPKAGQEQDVPGGVVDATQPTGVLDVTTLRAPVARPDVTDLGKVVGSTPDAGPAVTRPLPVPVRRPPSFSPPGTVTPGEADGETWHDPDEDADDADHGADDEPADRAGGRGDARRPRGRRLPSAAGIRTVENDGGRSPRCCRARRVLATFLVLALLAGGVVVGANLYVRSTLEGVARSALPGLSADSTVHTPAWVLPQVMGGSIDQVTVEGSQLDLASGDGTTTELDDVRIEMTGVGTSSQHTASRLAASAVVPWPIIEDRVVASSIYATGIGLDARDDGSIVATNAFIDASLILDPSLDADGNIVLTITSAKVRGLEVSVESVTGLLGLDEPEYVITTDFLPTGLTLTSISTGQNGLHAVISGNDLDLDSL